MLVRALMGPMGPQGQLVFDPALDFEWIASPEIVHEHQDVLDRPELQRHFWRLAERTVEGVSVRLARATMVEPVETPRICRDPNDDMFLAAALAGSADAIVSEDHDLLSLGVYEGMSICTVQAMIAVLAGRDERDVTS
ncbi:MAG: putative toxin-antitoxin system toxin component, PIN family [Chloroflexota bacterium]|nr:putative toxin-antitoxin system toxin component, PIN family [Chloroflexota bacterium]